MLRETLLGKPVKHPLHPMLVHLPIALFVLSLILDLASYAVHAGNPLVRGAFYAMVFGILMAIVAAIPGFVDWTDIRGDHPAGRIATYHMLLNLVAVGLYAVNVGLRIGALEAVSTPGGPLGLSLIAMVILGVSGYLGGMLVYDDGIGVGRHRRRGEAPPPPTYRVSSDQAVDGFIPVAEMEVLPIGQLIRAEVDGQVIAIANVDGELRAFQEFCSHRYGPLSEGAIVDGQIQCPWHRSCFDTRTGEVTQPPAKVNLKTFEATLRNGQICVRAGNSEPPAAAPQP